ncbi:uncharacterized protein [Argopecten irradians]|uniref:uncharacterized protein n=1 Tax=Argopecten irradians TaxID=31199 RepID=UPI0037229E5F
MMLLSVIVPVFYYLTGKRKESINCYRDTTQKICDWFYDRPSTSGQAERYATTSPRSALSSVRDPKWSDRTPVQHDVYLYSDQYWNDHYKQLKAEGRSETYNYFSYTLSNLTDTPVSLPGKQTACRGMDTPFQTAMGNLFSVTCTTATAQLNQGSSVDPCHFTPHQNFDGGDLD